MIDEKMTRDLLLEKMDDYQKEIYALNDFMAENPETGSEEFESSKAIVSLLRKHGIETEYPFAGLNTAFKGSINPEKKERMALLAEYDALRGLGHACGHCASGSASVFAALVLNEVKDQLDFGVDIIGTPDEEISGCKCIMADLGVFDGYDFAAMVHMGPFSTADSQFIALDGLGFKWHGQPAHAAAAPQLGRNALNAARLFMDATDMMRQHIIEEARMHGFIKNGGAASNIVPDFAEIEFLTRAPRREDLNDITAWVRDCAKAAALATRTEVEMFLVGEPFHELHISDLGRKTMCSCFDDLGIEYADKSGMTGSSDIGNVDYKCPAFHPIMGIGIDDNCHTQEFADAMTREKTHEAIRNSAAYLLTMAAKLYGNPQLLQQIKEEHKVYRGY